MQNITSRLRQSDDGGLLHKPQKSKNSLLKKKKKKSLGKEKNSTASDEWSRFYKTKTLGSLWWLTHTGQM